MLRATCFLRCEATFSSHSLLGKFLTCFQGPPDAVRDSVRTFLSRDIDRGCFTCSFNGVVSCSGQPIQAYLTALSGPFDLEGAAFTPHATKARGSGVIAVRHVRDAGSWKASGHRIVYPFDVSIETTDGMLISHLAFRCRLREALAQHGPNEMVKENLAWM